MSAEGGGEDSLRKEARSSSVVYPEAADQGKPKVFARQSFIVSGEDEEMAEAILEARKRAMERRRSTVDGVDAETALKRQESHEKLLLKQHSADAPKPDAKDANGIPLSVDKERRRSSVLNRIPDNLKALIQQADANGVQQKQEAPQTVAAHPQPLAPVQEDGAYEEDKRPASWCSSLLSCFKPAEHEADHESHDYEDNPPEGGRIERLLEPQRPQHAGRKLLVLDLDETLVHSSFKPTKRSDYILDIQVDSAFYKVYVLKRPGVDEFLKRVAQTYEVIIFTASLPQYANPLLDILDPNGYITDRLYREHCVFHEGYFVKDLTMLRGNADLKDTIIVDNSPMAYMFQPENAIDTTSWLDDMEDEELEVIADFLDATKEVADVRDHVEYWRMGSKVLQANASG